MRQKNAKGRNIVETKTNAVKNKVLAGLAGCRGYTPINPTDKELRPQERQNARRSHEDNKRTRDNKRKAKAGRKDMS